MLLGTSLLDNVATLVVLLLDGVPGMCCQIESGCRSKARMCVSVCVFVWNGGGQYLGHVGGRCGTVRHEQAQTGPHNPSPVFVLSFGFVPFGSLQWRASVEPRSSLSVK